MSYDRIPSLHRICLSFIFWEKGLTSSQCVVQQTLGKWEVGLQEAVPLGGRIRGNLSQQIPYLTHVKGDRGCLHFCLFQKGRHECLTHTLQCTNFSLLF